MRNCRDFDPVVHRAGNGTVSFHFMIEFGRAIRVRAENHIIAVRVLNTPAIRRRCQIRIGAADEQRKIDPVCVRDLRMIYRDDFLKGIGTGAAGDLTK